MEIKAFDIFFVLSFSPKDTLEMREAVESILATATGEQTKIGVAFMEEGVLCLNKEIGNHPEQKEPISKIIETFPLYEINDVYISQESMDEYKLVIEDLIDVKVDFTPLPVQTIRLIMQKSKQTLIY